MKWINYTALGFKPYKKYSVPLTRKLEEAFETFGIKFSDSMEFPFKSMEAGVIINSITNCQIKCDNNPTAPRFQKEFLYQKRKNIIMNRSYMIDATEGYLNLLNEFSDKWLPEEVDMFTAYEEDVSEKIDNLLVALEQFKSILREKQCDN